MICAASSVVDSKSFIGFAIFLYLRSCLQVESIECLHVATVCILYSQLNYTSNTI